MSVISFNYNKTICYYIRHYEQYKQNSIPAWSAIDDFYKKRIVGLISWNFIYQALDIFNFGQSMINWFKTFIII